MKNDLKEKKQPFAIVFRQLLAVVFLSVFALSAQAQNKVISGKVADEKNVSLPGVNIVVKGTNVSAQTDFDGQFKINASANDQLIFTYVGFEPKTVSVGGSSVLKVNLTETSAKLNEVVVVGYGTQKKATLTGSVSVVTSKAIENRPATSLQTALQGTVPGMTISRTGGQPGNEGLGIQIRGASSANGAVNPLLLVDGVATDLNNLQTINPADVETISVLKDGAAAAIYGAQAAGGVILVTTKRGKSGKTIFQFDTQLAVQRPMNKPERLSLFDEATIANLSRTNRGQAAEYSPTDMDNIRNNVPYIINPTDPNRYTFYNQHDYTKDIIANQALLKTNNLSARGGTEKTNFLFSLGHLDQDGMLKVGKDHFKRLNVRMNIGTELTKNLFLDSYVSYANSVADSPSSNFSGVFGNIYANLYKNRLRYPIFTPDGHLNGDAGASGNNGYALLSQGGYNQRIIDDIDGSFQLTIKDLAKGLKFRAIYGHKIKSDDSENFKRTVELWGRYAPVYYLNSPNSYTLNQSVLKTNNFQFLTDYNLTIAENHKFTALLGYQWEDYRYSNVTTSATDLKSNDLPTLNLGDESTRKNSQDINTLATQSLFGRLNYTYKDKYILDFTLRSDENSRLAPDLRTKVFPSASLGWNIQKEEWFSNNVPFVSVLKPRVSWGQLGNSKGIGYYDYMYTLSQGSNVVLGSPETKMAYFYEGTIPSSDLSWETVETYNYGIDFGFFQNKLTGTFDYYTKANKNMLTPLNLPATFGTGTPKINNGILETWGWEFAISFKDKIGSDFNYGVGFNIDNNDNKLTNYAGVSVVALGTNALIEGYPLNTIWGYQTAPGYINTAEQLAATPVQSPNTGIGDIAYIDQNGDGKINVGDGTKENHGDLVQLGVDQQQYNFGFNLNASWKNLDFSMFVQGVGKRAFKPDANMIAPFMETTLSPMPIHMDYWTPENPNAAFPRPYLQGQHNYVSSDRWVLDGAYARLKNIQLGYSLSNKVTDKIFFSKVRLYVSAENIATVTKLGIFDTTFDPEQKNATYADYPVFATVALGVNLLF